MRASASLRRPVRGPRRYWRALMDLPLGRLLRWLVYAALVALLLAILAFVLYVVVPTHTIPASEPVDDTVWLDQGWSVEERETWYYTAQGTSLPQGELIAPLRYVWFVHLEMPIGRERFADPAHLRRYRFLVDAQPSARNPDLLPVGFTRHFNTAIGEDVLDITCAACHNGEIHAVQPDGRRIAIRIDGGQAMHAFTDMQRGSFVPTLAASLIATWANPLKFNRFARRVIGARYPAGRDALRSALWDSIKALAGSGQNNPLRHLYPVREGFGRTDALGRIANTAFGDHLVPGNYQVADAPVSYPYLWNIWKFDWVQYTGSVAQPLARNVGEAMGVGAVLRLRDAYGNPLPPAQRLHSSVRIGNLVAIEHTLQTLAPPAWPEHLLGAIDRDRAERGAELFDGLCRRCHGPHEASAALQQATAPGKPGPWAQWRIKVLPVNVIGTDATSATAFVERRYDLTPAGIDRDTVTTLLRPLRLRALARDARYRLASVVEGRQAQGEDAAALAALLAQWPDPDAGHEPTLPLAQFAQVAGALAPRPVPARAPAQPWDCDLDCQTDWLAWTVGGGAAAAIDGELAAIDPAALDEGTGLNLLGLLIKHKWFADHRIGPQQQACIEGFGTLDLPQVIAGYKPRPLAGVWATPPFLHNGAVPSLYQMLLPPDQRSARFFVGRRDFDPRHVGYVTEPDADGTDDGFWLDTTQPGNHNGGHGFTADAARWAAFRADPHGQPLPDGVIGPLLDDEERWSLVEYLKVHRDPATPDDFVPADCGLGAPTP